ncbi:MAG: asparagine synthase (glutamine-hydrolyzing) [Candidatus Scalindua sp.]
MCGILFTNKLNISKGHFAKALSLMRHRGPDAGPGIISYKHFKFGHNRLKILDLEDRSNQPFWSHNKRYVMIYNGEVYNYRELQREYKISHVTTSDTEIILELYALKGPQMLKLLNGMFALIILDTKTDDLFIARDRLGIKPLYYSKTGEELTVASEISPVLDLTDKTKFDEIGLRQYRKLRAFFNGRTAYTEIEMFPAGHYMLNGRVSQYWHLPDEEKEPPCDEELRELIVSSVSYRCISDVPVGSYLSGGIDSTIIASLASKPNTWTVGFADNNEFYWADLAAKHLKSIHSEVLINKEEFVELAKEMIAKRKEPLSVPNEVLLYKMTREVKNENTVILSGEGADELFYGYDRIFIWAANHTWDIEEFSNLYSYGTNDDVEIVEEALSPFIHQKKAIDIVSAFFQTAHLHGLLRRLDNSTMQCSVEARVPFVDHRLVERMAGVPFNYRMEEGSIKAPLKRIFKSLVPHEIINRAKIGFPVPLDSIPFKSVSAETAMDNWLEFNLSELGVCIDDL